MSDDGLMLNFAAPMARAPARKISGKRHHERPRISNNNSATRQQSTAATEALSTSQVDLQTQKINLLPQKVPLGKARASEANPGNQTPKEQAPVVSASQSRQASSSSKRSGPDPAPRNGFISSLFTGGEASIVHKNSASSESETKFTPTNAPSAGTAFGALGLDPLLVAHLQSSKEAIERPTSIQRNSLPFLLSGNNAGRDALLHAQTGSGKTLSYLLPIIQSLLPLCETSWIDRSCLGTIAIILAPTRELAHQIYEVAERLCNLHLAAKSNTGNSGEVEEGIETRRTRWIVPGLLSGGATRNHEKSRLRKGLPLIVATPGRLLDHLRNTTSLDVGRLQWLVLDEADRLLQLGFEQTLTDIMKAIDGRRRAACEVQRERMMRELGSQHQGTISDQDVMDTFGELWWRYPRRTILCSATLDEGVQVLAGKSLSNPRVIRGEVEKEEKQVEQHPTNGVSMTAPAQLQQNYIVMPTKQRLIVLVALLRHAISTGKSRIMVFLSCTDSVDFHWSALGGIKMASSHDVDSKKENEKKESLVRHESEMLPSTSVFKLHGSLSQHERQTSLKMFSQSKQSAVLLCTSVASRGLDLDVSVVVQLDPPTEKGVDEYLHRIGRTARVGEEGASWLLLLPSEEGCVAAYEEQMGSKGNIIKRQEADAVLRKGFTGQDLWQTQARATEVQMAFERWVLEQDEHAILARKAYLSHLRAYATHPPSERQYFSLSNLQLGHLAKAFALREAPGVIRSKFKSGNDKIKKDAASQILGTEQPGRKRKRISDVSQSKDRDGSDDDAEEEEFARRNIDFVRNKETEAKMYAKVREMGKLNRKGGVLGAYGVDEYQIGV